MKKYIPFIFVLTLFSCMEESRIVNSSFVFTNQYKSDTLRNCKAYYKGDKPMKIVCLSEFSDTLVYQELKGDTSFFRRYYRNGNLMEKGVELDGEKVGKWILNYENGKRWSYDFYTHDRDTIYHYKKALNDEYTKADFRFPLDVQILNEKSIYWGDSVRFSLSLLVSEYGPDELELGVAIDVNGDEMSDYSQFVKSNKVNFIFPALDTGWNKLTGIIEEVNDSIFGGVDYFDAKFYVHSK